MKPAALRPKAPREPGMAVRTLACFAKVREMLTEGIPVPDIAAFIQEEAGEYQGASRASVIRSLYRYKDSLPPGELLQGRLPTKHAEAVRKVNGAINEIEELADVYRLQRDRITKLYAIEKEMKNVLFPNLSQELRVLLEIARDSLNAKKLSGLLGPPGTGGEGSEGDSKTTELTVRVKTIEHAHNVPGKILSNPESVHRLVGVYKALEVLANHKGPEVSSS